MQNLSDRLQASTLIVADKEDARLYRSLQLNGERVERLDINDCIDFIKNGKADVIVLDCGYRVSTGLSTLRQIKESCPDILVVFLTDQGSEDVAIHAFTQGAREYLKKPVNIYDLKRTVERLLSMKRALELSGSFRSTASNRATASFSCPAE